MRPELVCISFRFIVPDDLEDRAYEVTSTGAGAHREVRVFDFESRILLWKAPLRGPLNSNGARRALEVFFAAKGCP